MSFTTDKSGPPPFIIGGGGGSDGGGSGTGMDYSSSSNLWLAVTNVSNGLAYFSLNKATNQVYGESSPKAISIRPTGQIEQAV